MRASQARHRLGGRETDAADRSGSAEGGRDAPAYPLLVLGSHRAWTGPRGTCHRSPLVGVRYGEHGRLREGWEGEWAVGKGDPNDTPKPARRVGWGLGVCARESRVHGDEHPWRRPLACGKTGAKVPSERASGPRGIPWRLEQCEGTLQGVWPWRRTAGVEPCEVKTSSTVLNGRDEETYRKATRLVPTQLRRSGFQARLTASVRCFPDCILRLP
jgi:hypothetical protein